MWATYIRSTTLERATPACRPCCLTWLEPIVGRNFPGWKRSLSWNAGSTNETRACGLAQIFADAIAPYQRRASCSTLRGSHFFLLLHFYWRLPPVRGCCTCWRVVSREESERACYRPWAHSWVEWCMCSPLPWECRSSWQSRRLHLPR